MLMGTLYKRGSFLSESVLVWWSYIPHMFGVKQNWFTFQRSLTEGFLLFEVSAGNKDRYWNTP